MVGANAAGLKTGVYLYSYATTVEAAMGGGPVHTGCIAPFTVSMPVVFDLEDAVHKTMTPEQLQALTVVFCSIIQSAGYQHGVLQQELADTESWANPF